MIVSQRNGDRASAPVGIGDGKVGVFCGAALVPDLRCCAPAGQVDGGAGAVFELQRDAVVRPALQADVVGAG